MKRVLIFCLFFLVTQFVIAENISLSQLLAQLNFKSQTAQINYTETRYLHFLNKPLVSTGTLYFHRPNYLEQEVISPQPGGFVINQQQLTITDNNKTYTVKLSDYPNLWAMSTTLQALLTNDLNFLSRYYNSSIIGTLAQWQLQLMPKPQVNIEISKIIINGKYNQIETITLQFNNGDWLQQQLTKVIEH